MIPILKLRNALFFISDTLIRLPFIDYINIVFILSVKLSPGCLLGTPVSKMLLQNVVIDRVATLMENVSF